MKLLFVSLFMTVGCVLVYFILAGLPVLSSTLAHLGGRETRSTSLRDQTYGCSQTSTTLRGQTSRHSQTSATVRIGTSTSLVDQHGQISASATTVGNQTSEDGQTSSLSLIHI